MPEEMFTNVQSPQRIFIRKSINPLEFWLHVNECAFPSPPGHMHEADNHWEVWKRCRSSLSGRSASSQIPDVQPDVAVTENTAVI